MRHTVDLVNGRHIAGYLDEIAESTFVLGDFWIVRIVYCCSIDDEVVAVDVGLHRTDRDLPDAVAVP